LKNRCLQFKDFTFSAVFLNAVVYLKRGKAVTVKGAPSAPSGKLGNNSGPLNYHTQRRT